MSDKWLREEGLDIGSEWPDYSDYVIDAKDVILKDRIDPKDETPYILEFNEKML